MARGFLVGENLKDKIKSTIAKVDGMIPQTNITRVETRPGGGVPSADTKPYLAAYPRTLTWHRGAMMTVTLYTHKGGTVATAAYGPIVQTNPNGTVETKKITALNILSAVPPRVFSTGTIGIVGGTGATQTAVLTDALGPTPTMAWCIIEKTRSVSMLMDADKQPIRICTYTGTWAKGAAKEVKVMGAIATNETLSVTNLFYPMLAAPQTAPKSCAAAAQDGEYYLIAAEC
jgi:hypothetical protein